MVKVSVVEVKGLAAGEVAEATPGGDSRDSVAVRSAAGNTRGAAVPEGPLLNDFHN